MKVNNGGPAFPSQHTITDGAFNPHTGTVAKGNQVYIELGASLRDYFAAQALASVYAVACQEMYKSGYPESWRYGVALDAYAMADAMLAERAKGASNG